jgi:hypothetical protein
MKDKEYYLIAGVFIGGGMWGSMSSLLENNGILAILGLALSCIVMGVGLGMNIGAKNDE